MEREREEWNCEKCFHFEKCCEIENGSSLRDSDEKLKELSAIFLFHHSSTFQPSKHFFPIHSFLILSLYFLSMERQTTRAEEECEESEKLMS
jgi:hypothetical protein